MNFDKDGIEIMSHEEEVKRAFKYDITYFKNPVSNENLINHVNTQHMIMLLQVREKALNQIFHKIKVFVNGLPATESANATEVIQYFKNNAEELKQSNVERIDLRYEKL